MIFDDLHKLCRLCFHNEGENDVTTVPILLDTIKDFYNIKIKSTDKYTKLICQKCTEKIQAFSWHKRVVDSAQVLFTQRIQMAEQMNHIKLEPDASTETTFDDTVDEMTEVEAEMSTSENSSDKSRIEITKNTQNVARITRRRATMITESLSKSIDEVKQKDTSGKSRDEHKLSKIKNRRATMAVDRPTTPHSRSVQRNNKSKKDERKLPIVERPLVKPFNEENIPKSSRKRRLSHTRSNDIEDKTIIRNHSDTRKEGIESKAKKMKPNEGLSNKHSSSKSSSTSEKPRHPKLTSDKHSSTHAKPSHTKHRDKKLASVTPPITQFFAQATLKCSTCSVILKSQKELDFHLSIHKKGQCTACRQYIRGEHADTVQMHMISCLFLDNELPVDYLTHLLKVKVGVNRLTPTKIDEIRKNLSKTEISTNDTSNDVNHETEQNEACVTESAKKGTNQQKCKKLEAQEHPTQKSSERSKEKLTDGEKSKKPKLKKTPIKSKTSHGEGNEELSIKENQSAAIMWNDETTMNKLFMYRNFESEKPVYIQIKPVLGAGLKNLNDERFERLIQGIRVAKEKTLVQENVRRPVSMITPLSALPILNTSIEKEKRIIISNAVNNAVHFGIPNANGLPDVNKNIHAMPAIPSTPASSNTPTTADTPGVYNAPIVANSPQLLEPPKIGFPRPMNSPRSIGSPKPVNTLNTQNQVNLPTQMQNPHKLVPMRNRAMSIHLSAPGFSPMAQLNAMRRQSVCEKIDVTPINLSNSQHSQSTQLQSNPKNGSHAQSQPIVMTKIHNADFLQSHPNPNQNQNVNLNNSSIVVSDVPRINQLKVLTPEDLNLRAVNYCQPAVEGNLNRRRIDSSNSAENVDNNNVKRPRTKTTPVRNQLQQLSDDASISISISLTRLDTNQVELTFSVPSIGKINYDTLTIKRKQEIQSSLIKNDVWKKMLHYLKQIPPTNETLQLFGKILPQQLNEEFFSELKKVYGNRSG